MSSSSVTFSILCRVPLGTRTTTPGCSRNLQPHQPTSLPFQREGTGCRPGRMDMLQDLFPCRNSHQHAGHCRTVVFPGDQGSHSTPSAVGCCTQGMSSIERCACIVVSFHRSWMRDDGKLFRPFYHPLKLLTPIRLFCRHVARIRFALRGARPFPFPPGKMGIVQIIRIFVEPIFLIW